MSCFTWAVETEAWQQSFGAKKAVPSSNGTRCFQSRCVHQIGSTLNLFVGSIGVHLDMCEFGYSEGLHKRIIRCPAIRTSAGRHWEARGLA